MNFERVIRLVFLIFLVGFLLVFLISNVQQFIAWHWGY